MHTPAPVFEHGAARNKRRASKATKRGGWLHKTLPKTPMGQKGRERSPTSVATSTAGARGLTKIRGIDMQLLRERRANRRNHVMYCCKNCREYKREERHRERVAADGTKRKDQRKLVKTKSSMAKD